MEAASVMLPPYLALPAGRPQPHISSQDTNTQPAPPPHSSQYQPQHLLLSLHQADFSPTVLRWEQPAVEAGRVSSHQIQSMLSSKQRGRGNCLIVWQRAAWCLGLVMGITFRSCLLQFNQLRLEPGQSEDIVRQLSAHLWLIHDQNLTDDRCPPFQFRVKTCPWTVRHVTHQAGPVPGSPPITYFTPL